MKCKYLCYILLSIFVWQCFAYNEGKITEADYEKTVLNRIRQIEIMNPNENKVENKQTVDRQLKVMNYNVLAQDLIEQHGEYYQHHAPEFLAWEYRSPLLLEQITTFLPDILTLQEVQESHIGSFYKKLETYGYRGIFKRRTGNKTDGCSFYYMSTLLDLIEYNTVEYYRPEINNKLLNRPNVAIIARLRSKTVGPRLLGKELIVANTHLLYNPRRNDVRVAQIQVLLAEIDKIIRKMEPEKPAVLLMGDLNSLPNSPVVKLIHKGKLTSFLSHLTHKSGISNECTYLNNNNNREECQLGEKDQDQCDISHKLEDGLRIAEDSQCTFSHNLNFKSVYNWKNSNNISLATTFQDQWIIVDYMFYTNNMKLISRLKLPTVEECTNEIGWIPNKISPSDHFPLAATFLVE